jgi:16S rRNA (cytosine967-C5)-methyltransferase
MASPSVTARSLAWRVLQRVDHEGAYANLALRAELDRCRLDERDRHFATDLVYGTTRMRRACDALVDRFVVREPDPSLRSLLRLGAYQLAFLGTAPHAAVSATVDLAPRRSRGFVNVVLRRVADTPMVWPDEATRLSYPDWIVERLTGELGHADAVAALERMNQPAPVSTRDDGYVQDLASQWVAALAAPEQGQLVFDACAGPAGRPPPSRRTAASSWPPTCASPERGWWRRTRRASAPT